MSPLWLAGLADGEGQQQRRNHTNPIRSITLSASDEPHDTGDAYSGYLERKQVVLAFPYVPSPVGPELTSLKVSVFTKTTNYAGTGAANASTAKILSSDITVRCIKR